MGEAVEKKLSAAAQRALAEAVERRAKAVPVALIVEVNGTKGLEPTRYGDWEQNGLTSDF